MCTLIILRTYFKHDILRLFSLFFIAIYSFIPVYYYVFISEIIR